MPYLLYFMLPIVLLCSISTNSLAIYLKDERVADYVSNPKYLEYKSGYASHAYEIFNTLKQTIPLPINTLDIRLALIRTVNAKPLTPMAIAVFDGVVLSDAALELIYADVTPEVGDARLAFVLAHELVHIEQRDIQRELHSDNEEWRIAQLIDREMLADKRGFMYAAIANYPVQHLLAKSNFFEHWHHATTPSKMRTHLPPAERQQILFETFAELLERFNYFKIGIGLVHFNRCPDITAFLNNFIGGYEAPQVLDTKAYCDLQTVAQDILKPHYCVPSLLNIMHKTAVFNNLRQPVDSQKFLLDQTKSRLKRVLSIKEDYFPAYLNLAATYLYLEQINDAKYFISKAIELAVAQKSTFAKELKAFQSVIMYEAGMYSATKVDTWNNAMQDIKQYATSDASACILYNTALLLEQRPRNESLKYWRLLADRYRELPPSLQKVVCDRVACIKPAQQTTAKQLPLPINVSQTISTQYHQLQTWQRNEFKLDGRDRGYLYQNPAKTQLLMTIKDYAEFFIDKHPKIMLAELDKYCPLPLYTKPVLKGKLLVCQEDWAALIDGDTVQEIWVNIE